jgi:hypothetical protein
MKTRLCVLGLTASLCLLSCETPTADRTDRATTTLPPIGPCSADPPRPQPAAARRCREAVTRPVLARRRCRRATSSCISRMNPVPLAARSTSTVIQSSGGVQSYQIHRRHAGVSRRGGSRATCPISRITALPPHSSRCTCPASAAIRATTSIRSPGRGCREGDQVMRDGLRVMEARVKHMPRITSNT